jgi:hypothetical protein
MLTRYSLVNLFGLKCLYVNLTINDSKESDLIGLCNTFRIKLENIWNLF